MKQTKTNLADFILDDYHLNDETLFKLSKNLEEEPVNDAVMAAKIKAAFSTFKLKKEANASGKKIIPDSIHRIYFPQ